ncbi:hypothetical protein [Streptomyces roseolus]|uniref:hypothetical protein n=1 Tax=Streptomyces roseolus TaxID=67358 RepID=UPI0037A0E90B
MLAVSERVSGAIPFTETLLWHKPVGHVTEEFQPIACSDTDGIVFPPPKQKVPLRLDVPGERWCPDCLAVIRSGRSTKTKEG